MAVVENTFLSTNGSELRSVNANYATARDASSGVHNWALVVVGQENPAATYYIIERTYILFDTSSIPLGASITSAKLYLYGWLNLSTTDFDVVIQNGQPDYPHNPVVDADYDRTLYSGDGGSFNSSTYVDGYNLITLNADGRSWIQCGTTTKLCLRSSRDISNTAPNIFQEVMYFYFEVGDDDKKPKLVVEYDSGGLDVDIECPLCTISDITPLTPIVAAGAPGFQSIPRYHVGQLVDDDNLNTYLHKNLDYIKAQSEASLYPTYSDYISWVGEEGFDLGDTPAQSVFGGVSLDLTGSGTYGEDPSTAYVAEVRQKAFNYKIVNDRQITIDFVVTYIDDPGHAAVLHVGLTTDTDGNYFNGHLSRIYLQNGCINPNLGNYTDGECFIPLRMIYKANNWCKFFRDGKLMWTATASSLVDGDMAKLFTYGFAGYEFVETGPGAEDYYTNYYESQWRISRVLITQEY